MSPHASRAAVHPLLALATLVTTLATVAGPTRAAGPAASHAGGPGALTVTARYATLSADRTQVLLVGAYSCGPFAAGVPDRGVVDLEVRQMVHRVEVRAIGFLEPTQCDGEPHAYAEPLAAVAGTLRRGAATWSASGYVEGDGGLQSVFVPPTPIRLR
jgi:hypothetical protein